jgi:hypothetical protein
MKRFTLVILIALILPTIASSVPAQVPQESKLDRILREAEEKNQQAEQVKRKTAERYQEIESYYVKLKGMDKIEESTLSSESKVEAWSEFINKYSTDNPRLGEAQEKLKFWEKMARLSVDERRKKANEGKRNVYMGMDLSLLPPGLQHCRDKMVALVYGAVIGEWIIPNKYSFSQRLAGSAGPATEQIGGDSKWIEPAVYLTAAHLEGGVSLVLDSKLKEENPGLYYFALGIDKYFDKWVKGTEPRMFNGQIETNFIRSIFTSAYISQEEGLAKADEFFHGDLAKKEIMISEVLAELKNMKGAHVKSIDPSNAYNRRLNASWSSFWLTTQYDFTTDRKSGLGDLINGSLEKPLRKFTKRIRANIGGPYYNIPDSNI